MAYKDLHYHKQFLAFFGMKYCSGPAMFMTSLHKTTPPLNMECLEHAPSRKSSMLDWKFHFSVHKLYSKWLNQIRPWLSHTCIITTFFPKPSTTFLTYFSRGERQKYAGKKVCLNQVSNSKPPDHKSSSPLSYQGGASWYETTIP